MWKYILVFVIFMHGMAHISGFIASWSKLDTGYTDKPWIFPGNFSLHSAVGKAWGLLWILAMLGLVGTSLGIIFSQNWWPSLAMAAAVISLVAIFPWWQSVPAGAKAGALFDILIIVVLLSPWGERIKNFLS